MRTKTLLATAATALIMSATASAASLQLGDGFFATAVNGQSVPAYASSHQLSSGKQVITIRYEENKHISRERNEYSVSAPMYVVFDASGSASYSIEKSDSGYQLTSSNGRVNAKFYDGEQVIHKSLM